MELNRAMIYLNNVIMYEDLSVGGAKSITDAIKIINAHKPFTVDRGKIAEMLEKYENRIRNTLKTGSEYKVATLSHQIIPTANALEETK